MVSELVHNVYYLVFIIYSYYNLLYNIYYL